MEQVRYRAINPGEFTEIVTFLKRTKQRTTTGAMAFVYTTDGRAFAKTETKSVQESSGDVVVLDTVLQFTCYNRNMDSSFRIERKGKRYDIISLVEVERDYLRITAREVQDDNGKG